MGGRQRLGQTENQVNHWSWDGADRLDNKKSGREENWTYWIVLIRYPAGIINWLKEEVEALV